jgi:hypothetical protein
LKRKNCIWFFPLLLLSAAPLAGQQYAAGPKVGTSFSDRALRDADIEHRLHFSQPADEVDYWNDQRAFEQRLYEKQPDSYRMYLAGKKLAYQRHQQACSPSCKHGDYYLRQASFYLQYDAGDQEAILPFYKAEAANGWEVSYRDRHR